MISPLEQLAKELAPTMRRYHPTKPVLTAAQLERRRQISASMRRIRARRRAAGLNNQGKPLKAVNRKFINRKYRNRNAKT